MLYAPVPESSIVCGLAMPESATERSATRLPMADGLNETVTEQDCPALRDAEQLLAAMLKSLVPLVFVPGMVLSVTPFTPTVVMPLMVSEPEPPAVRVKVLLTAVPTVCEPHEVLPGLIARDVVGAGVPVPVSATVCGLLLAPSLMVRDAFRVPVVVGSKSKYMAQDVEGASDDPHF